MTAKTDTPDKSQVNTD